MPASTRLRRLLRRPRTEPGPVLVQDDLSALTPADREIVERALPYTMTGVPRLQALVDSVRYCVERGIEGSFVECGVWRGGSVLAMLLTLQEAGDTDRDVYLYDTFEGMTEPTERDVSPLEPPALETWAEAQAQERRPWGELFDPEHFNEQAVRATVRSAGYPEERVHFVAGRVEDTIPAGAPERIALLRLDTDWYASTLHEMEQLYPRLADSGVLLIDDYGHWEGARRAVDEYFAAHPPRPLLARIDYTGRIAVKH